MEADPTKPVTLVLTITRIDGVSYAVFTTQFDAGLPTFYASSQEAYICENAIYETTDKLANAFTDHVCREDPCISEIAILVMPTFFSIPQTLGDIDAFIASKYSSAFEQIARRLTSDNCVKLLAKKEYLAKCETTLQNYKLVVNEKTTFRNVEAFLRSVRV